MISSIQQKDVTFQVCVVKLYNSQAQDIMDAKNPRGSKTLHTNLCKKNVSKTKIKILHLVASGLDEQMTERVKH